MKLRNWIHQYLSRTIFVLLILFFTINVVFSFYHCFKYVQFNSLALILIISSFIIILLFAIKKNLLLNISNKKFLWLLLIFTLLNSLTTFILPFIGFKDDPERYHFATLKLLDDFSSFDPTDIIQRRTIFYFYPIYLISSSILFLKTINIIITIITTLIIYRTFKPYFKSLLTFRVYMILFTFIPLRYTHINYLSHDLVALFFLSILLYCISELLCKRRQKIFVDILLTIFSAILIFILDFQKSLGFLLILSFIISCAYFFFYKRERKNKQVYIKVGFLIFIYFSIGYLAKVSLKMKESDKPQAVSITAMLFSYNELDGDGTYGSGAELRNNYFTKIENNKEAVKYAFSNYLSKIYYHPIDFIKLLFRKSVILSSYRAFHFFKDGENELLKAIVKKANYANSFYRLIFYVFCILGLLGYFINQEKTSFLLLFITIFSIVTIFLLLFFSEVAGSYMFINFIFINLLATKGVMMITKKKGKIKNYLNFRFGKRIVNSSILLITYAILIFFLVVALRSLLPFKTIGFNEVDYEKEGGVSKLEDSKPSGTYEFSLSDFKDSAKVILEKKIDYKTVKFYIEYNPTTEFQLSINDSIMHRNFKIETMQKDPIVKLIKFNSANLFDDFKMDLYFDDTKKDDLFKLKYLYFEK